MSSRLFAGAAALALFTSIACGGGGDTPAPDVPRTGPADVGVAAARVSAVPWGLALGAGYDTLMREGRTRCLEDVSLHEVEWSAPRLQRLQHPFSKAEAFELLGEADPVQRVRWQVDGELPLVFEAFAGDPRAVTLLYGAEVRTGSDRLVLDAAELTSTTPAPGTPEFTLQCGDEVAVEVEHGAQAFLLYQFWFQSDEARATFDRLVGVDVPLWELHARLAAADPALGSSYGGRIHQIWHGLAGVTIFSVDEGDVRWYLRGPPELDVADAFVQFVTTDGPDGLRAQAAGTPGIIGVTLAPWSSVVYPLRSRVPPPEPRVAPADVRAAREALTGGLAERLRARDRIRARQKLGFPLRAEQDAVDGDIGALRWALHVCHALLAVDDAAAVSRCTRAATPESLAAAGYTGKPTLAEL